MSELNEEWDRVSEFRDHVVTDGVDLSFDLVLAPTIMRLSSEDDWKSVIDAGCGNGSLTQRLAVQAEHVSGVDPSIRSIEIATKRHARPNIVYSNTTIEDYAAVVENRNSATLVVANMTMMAAPDLTEFLSAVASLLQEGCGFVFTITHPCFWPFYWAYQSESWFHYEEEQAIEAEYRISKARSGVVTTHFHRPLATYLNALREAGLWLTHLDEPLPDDDSRYPTHWEFPRFLAARAELR